MTQNGGFILTYLGSLSLNVQTFLVLLAVFLAVYHVVQWARSPANLPPGPRGYPVVGVLPLLGKKPYLTIQYWWRTYGDLFSMNMGSRLVVVINGIDMMKECFIRQGDKFSGRPWNYFKKLTKNTGIVFTEGEVWREHRRFALSCLRDFGMGKVSLERKIQEESIYLLNEMSSAKDAPFDIRDFLPKAVSNIVCSIIYGSRFDYHDEVFVANINALDQSIRKQSMLGVINFIPFLEFLPKVIPKDKLLLRNVMMRDQYAHEQIQRHKETFDAENPRDFIDAYLTRMHAMKNAGESTTFEERQLKRTIQDLFIAGSETLNTTLKWAFLFMAMYPEIQREVQKELDHVVGQSRMPAVKDRASMPYTEATIMECQRRGNIALFSVPRCTTEDVIIGEYTIPKGAWIFANRWGLHTSEKYWKRAAKFDPHRFLDDHGNVKKPVAFAPFGMGPRNCLGESLAKMELFLFFTCILQRYSLQFPEGAAMTDLEPTYGINMSPKPYLLVAKQR